MAELKKKTTTALKSLTITKGEALDLYAAFGSFDGREVKNGDGTIVEPFVLGDGCRWNIALNRVTLKPIAEAVTEARNQVLKQIIPKGETALPNFIKDKDGNKIQNPKAVEFEERYKKLLDEKVTVKLYFFKRDSWNADKNKFGPNFLTTLMLVTEKEKEDEVVDQDTDKQG